MPPATDRAAWLNGIAWPLLDQAGVSGGNFLTSVVLARSLSKPEYGTFSLLFLALFAINGCHASLVTYPLTVHGATASRAEIQRLIGAALIYTLVLGLAFAGGLAGVTSVLGRLDLALPVIAAMLAWQLQETVRRALLAHLQFRLATLPDLLSYGGQGALILMLHPTQLSTVFIIMAGTSLSACLWQLCSTGVAWRGVLGRRNVTSFWALGKFSLGGNVLNLVILQWASWLLGAFSGRVAVAAYQSLQNVAGLANPLLFSLSNQLTPAIARSAAEGIPQARKTVFKNGILYGALLLPCFLAVVMFPDGIMRLVYGAGSGYLALAPLLRVLVCGLLFQYFTSLIGAYEGGMGRPQTYLVVQIFGTATVVSAGLYLIHRLSVVGAIYTLLITSLVRLLVFATFSYRADRSPSAVDRAARYA